MKRRTKQADPLAQFLFQNPIFKDTPNGQIVLTIKQVPTLGWGARYLASNGEVYAGSSLPVGLLLDEGRRTIREFSSDDLSLLFELNPESARKALNDGRGSLRRTIVESAKGLLLRNLRGLILTGLTTGVISDQPLGSLEPKEVPSLDDILENFLSSLPIKDVAEGKWVETSVRSAVQQGLMLLKIKEGA